jgi:hypothetical protein
MGAVVTGLDVPAEHRRAAGFDGAHDATLDAPHTPRLVRNGYQ